MLIVDFLIWYSAKKVFILSSVENECSASAKLMGIVITIFKSLYVSENVYQVIDFE